MGNDPENLHALRQRLDEEEAVYASVLSALDALADFPLPAEAQKDLADLVARLNGLWESAPRPAATGVGGALRRRAHDALAPALDRQRDFNATLVQTLNGRLAATDALHARLKDLVAALIRYVQRVLPVMDARDRVASALATTRSELILEAFDRRQESLARRVEGLQALRDRLESLSAEVRALGGTLAAGAPPPAVAAAAVRAREDSAYAAFENRVRGDAEDLRERLLEYVPLYEGLAPVLDLGCGRGEFLDLLRERGIAARGVDGNAHTVQQCRARGLDVVHGDLVAFLRSGGVGSAGGVFAAQVVEHLPPDVLVSLLGEAHRVLRGGGLLVVETVNPRSVLGFHEVFIRDLTHEKPLHPETLRFLAAAAGFTDVRIDLKSPVDGSERLQSVPSEGLPPRSAAALNENIERLNGLLYGPREYALVARR